jgi:hypothetical protein
MAMLSIIPSNVACQAVALYEGWRNPVESAEQMNLQHPSTPKAFGGQVTRNGFTAERLHEMTTKKPPLQ